jgi:hypothetical protein
MGQFSGNDSDPIEPLGVPCPTGGGEDGDGSGGGDDRAGLDDIDNDGNTDEDDQDHTGDDDEVEVSISLTATSSIPVGSSVLAEYQKLATGKISLELDADDLPAGTYNVVVNGTVLGPISLNADDDRADD